MSFADVVFLCAGIWFLWRGKRILGMGLVSGIQGVGRVSVGGVALGVGQRAIWGVRGVRRVGLIG